MLPDAIRGLRSQLEQYQHCGLEMSPEAVTATVAILRTFEDEAGRLETRLADAEAELVSAPPRRVRGGGIEIDDVVVAFPIVPRPRPDGDAA